MIQNTNAWNSNIWQDELESRGISYDIRPTADLLSMDYSQYDMIITAGASNVGSEIYEAAELLYTYVDNGGIAGVSLCGQGGAATGQFGDITSVFNYSDFNYIYLKNNECFFRLVFKENFKKNHHRIR